MKMNTQHIKTCLKHQEWVSEASSYLSEKIYESHFKKITAHLKVLEKQQQQKGITSKVVDCKK